MARGSEEDLWCRYKLRFVALAYSALSKGYAPQLFVSKLQVAKRFWRDMRGSVSPRRAAALPPKPTAHNDRVYLSVVPVKRRDHTPSNNNLQSACSVLYGAELINFANLPRSTLVTEAFEVDNQKY